MAFFLYFNNSSNTWYIKHQLKFIRLLVFETLWLDTLRNYLIDDFIIFWLQQIFHKCSLGSSDGLLLDVPILFLWVNASSLFSKTFMNTSLPFYKIVPLIFSLCLTKYSRNICTSFILFAKIKFYPLYLIFSWD